MTHPSALIGTPPSMRGYTGEGVYPEIGEGVSIGAGVVVERGRERATRIGDGSMLLPLAIIGHDAQLGDNVEVGPGAVICGHAEVGKGAKIGANATVLPYRKIGAGARVGALREGVPEERIVEIWGEKRYRRLMRGEL